MNCRLILGAEKVSEESEKFPGFPPGAVGYCAMGHTEIWSKEIACPLCAMIKERNNFRTLCQKDTAMIKEKWAEDRKKEVNE